MIAFALNAGGCNRIDAESETLIASTLKANNGGGGFGSDPSETFIAHALRANGFDASEDGTGRGTPLVPVPILEAGARTGKSTTDLRAGCGIGEPGDPMYTLQSGKQHAIGFYANDSGSDAGSELAPTLRAINGGGGNHPAVAPNFRGRDGGTQAELGGDVSTALRSGGGTSSKPHTMVDMAVRRLTPIECARLQGFPDTYCHIPYGQRRITEEMAVYLMGHGVKCWRRKDRWYTQAPADGLIYRALGNSMAVPVMRWILERITAQDVRP